MDFPKYDGNVHPDEWIKDIQKYYILWNNNYGDFLKTAISLIDSTIELPIEINDIEKLRNALKEDISFTVFKNTNKRKLQLLKYILEKDGGETSKFISTFRKLCYNAEINDVEEQKKYLYKSLHYDAEMKKRTYNYPIINFHLDYISNEFSKKVKNVNSINKLIEKFEDTVADESKLIVNQSIVTLKHVATGNYLSSIKHLNYTTGSKLQLVFAGSPEPNSNSLWKIEFGKELASYDDASMNIRLQHIKSNSCLGILSYWIHDRGGCLYFKSPLTEHTEVNCGGKEVNWMFNHSKLENHQGYLKSNDTINLSIKKSYDDNGMYIRDGQVEFLCSHDVQFIIGNDNFQEVICNKERLEGNDEWCIELIRQGW